MKHQFEFNILNEFGKKLQHSLFSVFYAIVIVFSVKLYKHKQKSKQGKLNKINKMFKMKFIVIFKIRFSKDFYKIYIKNIRIL